MAAERDRRDLLRAMFAHRVRGGACLRGDRGINRTPVGVLLADNTLVRRRRIAARLDKPLVVFADGSATFHLVQRRDPLLHPRLDGAETLGSTHRSGTKE